MHQNLLLSRNTLVRHCSNFSWDPVSSWGGVSHIIASFIYHLGDFLLGISSDCLYLLINMRQIWLFNTKFPKQVILFPTLYSKTTPLSLPCIEVQHLNSYREVKFRGSMFSKAFVGDSNARGGGAKGGIVTGEDPALNLWLFAWSPIHQ